MPIPDKLLRSVAKAIEGPHRPVAGSKYTLQELRAHRWERLSLQDRGYLLIQARNALSLVWPVMEQMAEALEHANQIVSAYQIRDAINSFKQLTENDNDR